MPGAGSPGAAQATAQYEQSEGHTAIASVTLCGKWMPGKVSQAQSASDYVPVRRRHESS